MASSDINVEEVIKGMMSLEGSYAFVIFNSDGINFINIRNSLKKIRKNYFF